VQAARPILRRVASGQALAVVGARYLVQERNGFVQERNISRQAAANVLAVRCSALAPGVEWSYVRLGVTSRQTTWETRMTWKTPKIVEVPVGMEINMYACAARK